MASSTSPGGAGSGTSRLIPQILQTPITLDIFSRSVQLMLGRDIDLPDLDEEPAAPAAEKIQPVVRTLYPEVAPPPPPQPVAPPMRFDGRTKSLLVSLCAGSDANSGNFELAQTLLQCEQAPMTEQTLSRYRAVLQRVTLVARMVELVETDPSIPEGFRRAFDRLRFTLIKAALADSNFFSQRWHPLRSIAAGLAMRATTAACWDDDTKDNLAKALDEAVRDFDLTASFVRPMINRLQPLPMETMKAFAQQLHSERREREEIMRAQRAVDEQMVARVRGAMLDAPLRAVLESWKPVLVRQLNRHGLDSVEWRGAIGVIEELLRLAPGIQAGASAPKNLLERIEAGLIDAGRPVEPVMQLFEQLRKARPSPTTVATEVARAVMRTSPLSQLMTEGRWFRVFDHGLQRMRWLKAHLYDAGEGTVTFREMDGGTPLVMRGEQFLEDLRRGLSAPNSPEPELVELMAKLRAQAA